MNSSTSYVGLDVHKSTISVAIAEDGRDGDIRYDGVVENRADILVKLVERLGRRGQRLQFCYEAGPCGYGLHRLLSGLGQDCTVVAPSSILPGIGIEPTRSDTALDPAGRQAHSPVPPLDLHQIDRSRWAFGFGPRRGHFDLSHVPAGPARYRQVQHQLDWRSRCGHETRDLLALSFNPFSATVRAFGHRSLPVGSEEARSIAPS